MDHVQMRRVTIGNWSFLHALVLACISITACHGFVGDVVLDTRSWLVVPSGAKSLTRNSESAKFELSVSYPANDVLAEIGNELQLRGWNPVNEGVISGASNSHVEGWRTFLDADGSFAYRWMADWVDGSRNGVTYILTYHYPPAAGGRFTANDHLEVIVKFWPNQKH